MAITKLSELWISVLEDFLSYHPEIMEDDIRTWYPVGQTEINVVLKNDKRLVYNFINNVTTYYRNPEIVNDIDDAICKKEFSARLRKKMYLSCMSQERLSDETGITQAMLSRYMNGKALPTLTNLNKIAKALRCSISELGNV